MTNNFDEHDPGDEFNEHDGLTDETPKTGGMRGNLSEAWRTRPMFKFMVLLIGVFAVGIAAFNMMGGSGPTDGSSASLIAPPSIKEAPGGAVSPYMRQQTELANKERSEQAIANGGSALPTPIGATTDVGNFGNVEHKDDPLNELRAETENLKKEIVEQRAQQAQQQQQQAQQQAQRPPEQFDNTMADAMQRQMQQLLESWVPKGIKQVSVMTPEQLKADADKTAAANGGANAASTAAAQNAANQQQRKILVAAGTVSYAQIMTEANSDVPGPILANIVSGPLAGARAIGSFEVSQGYEKYLVLKFSVADKKGKDYQINAIALDPDTTLGGMATEVDERYFVRVVLPAAAGFLQGMGQALGQGDSTITSNGTTSISTTAGNGFKQGIYNGMGQAANTMGEFFQNQANLTKPLVRVAAGTPMGLFFVSPVYDTDIATAPQQTTGQAVYVNGGYPGTTVSGYGQQQPNPYGNNAAAGVPYPGYATPGSAYNNTGVTRLGSGLGVIGAPGAYGTTGGYGQVTGYGQ